LGIKHCTREKNKKEQQRCGDRKGFGQLRVACCVLRVACWEENGSLCKSFKFGEKKLII
jgi:hypothetical protein